MDAARTAPTRASEASLESALDAGSATSTQVGNSIESVAPTKSERTPGAILRHVGGRLVYWTPVFAALALFAQVAFLGLRPAISEARRLAVASDVLEARWAHDRGIYDAYELQLRVRQDPIFLERQRRLRRAAPAPVSAPEADPATRDV